MAAVEVSGSKAPKMDQSVEEGGGGDSGGTKERCTDDPNFAVMVAFLQVCVPTKCFFMTACFTHAWTIFGHFLATTTNS